MRPDIINDRDGICLLPPHHLHGVLLYDPVQLGLAPQLLYISGYEFCAEIFEPCQVEEPGSDEELQNIVHVHQLGQHLPTQLLQAGEQEHVGSVEQLPHHLLGEVTGVGIDETHYAAKY